MKIRDLCDLLFEVLKVDSLDDDVVFGIDKGTHIDLLDVTADYNAKTHFFILKEANNEKT